MADQAPRAEFHDIGKLIDWVAVGLHPPMTKDEPHEFERCVETEDARSRWGIELSTSRAWRNIVRKDPFRQLRDQAWPGSRDWIFASHADWLAAGYGRGISDEERIDSAPRHGRYCLWTGEEPPDPRLKEEQALREMIQFLNADPTWEEAERKYADLLRDRAETARPGLNVTTLLSHSRTVGKLARVLARLDWRTPANGAWKGQAEQEGLNKSLISAHYWVEFPHQPYRSKDMMIFDAVERFLDGVEQGEFADNVLSRFDNQVLAVFETPERMEAFQDAAFSRGLRLRTQSREQELGAYRKTKRRLGDFSGQRPRFVSPPNLPEQFDEPICEVCKMARATKNWLTDRPRAEDEDEEIGREDLCESCFEMRADARGLQKLKDWRAGGLVWVHLSLDVALLRESLKTLAREYLEAAPWHGKASEKPQVIEELDVSLPVVVDFVEDYKVALKRIHERLEALAGSGQVERLMDNLLAVRIRGAYPLGVMFACLDVLRDAFPRLCDPGDADVAFPIRVAFSVSNVKYPFFQHWRFLQGEESEVSFQLVNSGFARFKMKHSKVIAATVKSAAKSHASSLHNLAMMAASQPSVAQLALLDKTDRGLNLAELADLVSTGALDLGSARVLANLASREFGRRTDG